MRLAGVGLGWRPETAWGIQQRPSLGFTEVLAEAFMPEHLPPALTRLPETGVPVVVHGVSLSLGGAEPLDMKRLDHLARLAEALDAPLVSEHVAFVRAGGHEIGHLTAVPRTEPMLEILIDNVKLTCEVLPVPLALENIATLFEWPGAQMSEPEFLTTLAAETGCALLLDLANLHANAHNHGWDCGAYLDAMPLDQVAYVHVAGGVEREGRYYDTHAHEVSASSLALVRELTARGFRPPVLLERDDHFPGAGRLGAELDAVVEARTLGREEHDVAVSA